MTASLTMDEINAMSAAMKAGPGGAPIDAPPADSAKVEDKGAKPTPAADM